MHNRRLPRRDFLTALTATTALPLAQATDARALAATFAETKDDLPTIDAHFPGGNVIVERVVPRTPAAEGSNDSGGSGAAAELPVDIHLHQDPRDTPGFWFYWYFRVRNPRCRNLVVHFTKGNAIGARGPAVSTDGGNAWQWLGMKAVRGASFSYTWPGGVEEVRFCLAFPYLEKNLQAFLARHAGSPHLKVETHATTRKGRTTQRLRLGQLDADPEHRILLTCRHHCCEMMAGWALEGLLDAVLADTDDGRWFRKNTEVLAVPFMDKDGVEQGDQGKNRKPHDHNRDYLGEPLYPAVRALKTFVPQWSRGRLRIAFDLHCPWLRGGGDNPSSNERIFLVGNPDESTWERQQQFAHVLQEVQTGPLPYHPKHNIRFGQAWNTLKEPKSSSRWAATLPGVLVATTVEVPYANVDGQPVTSESARAFGRDLARALRVYLEKY